MSKLRPGVRLLALAAVVGGVIAMMASVTSTSAFVWDDIVNFREAQLSNLSLGYLVRETDAACCLGLRFVPMHRLAYWLIQDAAPLNFRVAQVASLVCFALILLTLHRLLVELLRSGPGPILLTLLYGAATVHVEVIQWWASSLDRLPTTLFSLLSILSYLYFVRTNSRRWLVLSVLALSLGLLFQIKAVLVPLYIVLIRILILSADEPVRESIAAARREWRVWLSYLVPVGLYLIVYVNRYGEEGIADPSLAKLVEYLPILWFRIVGPGLFGIFIPKDTGLTVAAPIMAAAQVVLVTVVVWTTARYRGAGRAWVFLAVTFVINAVVVGLTRIAADEGLFGPNGIAYFLRYNEEITYLVPIGLAAVLLRARRARAARPTPSGGLQRAAPALVGMGVATYLVLSWFSAARVSSKELWIGARARPYTENARDGLRALRESGRPYALVDGVTPYDFVPPLQVPYNSHSQAIPVIDETVTFDVAGRDLFHVGQDGVVRPVTFSSDAGGDAASLLATGSLGVTPVSPQFGERGLCVRSGPGDAIIALTPERPLTSGPLHLRMRYGSTPGNLLALAPEPVGGGPPPRRFVELPGGPDRTSVFSLDANELRRVYLVLAPETEMCVQRLEVGRLMPR